MSLASHRVVGRYLLCEAIASGGAATVHIGRLMGPQGFSRTVAIKRLHAQFARNSEFVSMFLDEARLASRIHHPNVVSPQDIVVIDDELLIVMDYVHGESLARVLRNLEAGAVPAGIASAIIRDVLLGLQAAHEATSEDGQPLEIVHRDVSPQNILLGQDGVARLVDFGVAKARNRVHQTDSGMVKGKPGYMAPEQVTGGCVDRRTDVFATGVVLWELLTGRKLFRGETLDESVQRTLHAAIEPPSSLRADLSPQLDEVAFEALARDPELRYQSAHAFALDLTSALAPASTLEVAAWLNQVFGAGLHTRAERLLEIEAAPLEDLTRGLPRPLTARAPTSAFELVKDERTDTEEPVSAAAASKRARPVGWRRGRAWLMLSLVLTLLALVWWTPWLARRGETAEPALQAIPLDPASIPRRAVAAREAATEAAPASVATPRVIEAEAAVEAQPLVSKPPASARGRVSPGRAPSRHAEERPSRGSKRSTACDLPFFYDERGVKHFKPECY